MQPTSLCRAVILLGGALLLSAWIFDEPSFFFAGGALWLFILLSLHQSISAARTSADHLSGERETKERFSRSGTRIHMTTTLRSQVLSGYHLEAEDMLPDSATDIKGETRGTFSGADGSCTLQYSFRLLAHGTIRPGGVILRCSDAFFTIKVTIQHSSLKSPALFAFPEKGSGYEGSGGYSDRETQRRTAIKSSGVHLFREYQEGDDIRAIDWKMTAKHGTTYVREYTGVEGGTATLVVDLPDDTTVRSEEIFSGIRKAVIQRMAEIQEQRESSRIVVLAGCEIIAMRDIDPGADVLHEISGTLIPTKRIHSLYRAYSPAMLAIQIRAAGSRMPFTPVAQTAVDTFGRSAGPIKFEEKMYCALASSHDTEIQCYTTGTGDLSQIWAVASAAYSLHRPVKLFLPEITIRESIRQEAEFFNVHSIEVIQ